MRRQYVLALVTTSLQALGTCWQAPLAVTQGLSGVRSKAHKKLRRGDCEASLDLPDPSLSLVRSVPDSQIFVAVFTRHGAVDKRNAIRSSWNVPQNVTVKFAVCNDSDGTSGGVQGSLEAEEGTFGDIAILDCKEGYKSGLLSRKVLAAMQFYLEKFSSAPFFMKIDDDSFPRFRALSRRLVGLRKYAYVGVLDNGAPVVRDEDNKWYEPEELYSEGRYPRSALGGPGYVLTRALVQHFLVDDRAGTESRMLYNEDKAVGLWVFQAKLQGAHVQYIDLPPSPHDFGNTCGQSPKTNWRKTWFTLLHNMSTSAMHCMGKLEAGRRVRSGCCSCP